MHYDTARLPADTQTLIQAMRNPELIRELHSFYRALERRIALHQPVCRNRGACCKFEQYGHRLFVTTLECIYFLARHGPQCRDLAAPEDAPNRLSLQVLPYSNPSTCPFQKGGACTTREGRPVGCRVFFCDSAAQGWQQILSEWALARLTKIHRQFNVPYGYLDWTHAVHQFSGVIDSELKWDRNLADDAFHTESLPEQSSM